MSKKLIKNVILSIDTTDNKEVVVSLQINDEKDEIRQLLGEKKSQVVLPLIDQLLKKNTLTKNDLTAIDVNPGPGSFTGIRVGITIANTLGTVLQIPVNGKKIGELVDPIYEMK